MSLRAQALKLAVLLFAVALALPVCAQNPAAAPQVSSGQSADAVLASVGGRTIRMSDLERYWQEQDAASFSRMRQQIYEANRRVLDDLIGTYLLEDEAKRRGVSVDALVEQETTKRIEPVTDAEVKQLYDGSQEREQGVSFESLRPAIVAFLERQRPVQARQAYIDELRNASSDLAVSFEAPRAVIDVLPTDPVSGPASARIQIVEFSDFQCPYCKRLVPVLKQIKAKYGDQVRVVWKDFPLPNHPDARPAAEAALCANDQGKFWEYHDKLFDNQSVMSVANLKQWAAELGANPATFDACFDGGTHRALVETDMEQGNRYGVSSTPTVFINGRAVVGALPIEAYEQIIQEELKAKG